MTVRLVDWADEEGARFGRSLVGSSAAAGTLDPNKVRDLKDKDGQRLAEVVKAHGVDVDTAHQAGLLLPENQLLKKQNSLKHILGKDKELESAKSICKKFKQLELICTFILCNKA